MSLLSRLNAVVSARAALRRGIELADGGRPKQAFPLFARAAKAGIQEAVYRVGRCYFEGAGVPISRNEGARWLEHAAEKGHIEAQALLAALYLHGLGSTQATTHLFATNATSEPDFATAARFARMAAEGGSADGQAVLAYILTSGPEPMRDLAQAHV